MFAFMRRILTTVLLLAIGGALGGCASGSHTAARTATEAAASTLAPHTLPGSSAQAASKPLTKAQARAFAQAVNLRAADLPDFKVTSEHEHETAAEKRLEHDLLRCVGAKGSEHPALAEVGSKEFERETNAFEQSVQSEVSIARTAGLAAKELAELRSNHVRVCLTHYLTLLFKSQKYNGASVSPVSISQGTPSAPGTQGSFSWRITSAIALKGVRVHFYIDILGFVYGPAEVSLFAAGVPQPFPAANEEQLFSLLVKRATSQHL
jgi:hypothetical protein